MPVEAIGLRQALLPFPGVGSAGAATCWHGHHSVTGCVLADKSLTLQHGMPAQVDFDSSRGNVV